MNKRRYALGAIAALAVGVLTACSSSGSPTSTGGGGSTGGSASAGSSESIVVGSADFPENEMLAYVYADALKAKGIKATTKLDIGSRQVYIPALQDGSIDLIPEYNGNLLRYFNKNATQVSTDDVNAALATVLPSSLKVLTASSAQDKDAIVVTKATATKYNLTSIADLAPVAGTLTMGAAPEFQTVADGLPALKSLYGVTFGTFKALDASGPLTVNALKNGQIDAGDIYTTDPSVAANGFVSLADPKNEFAAQNVLPLISASKDNATITAALDAVSAKLDTPTLVTLVGKVVGDKQDPAAVAQAWLTSVGLG